MEEKKPVKKPLTDEQKKKIETAQSPEELLKPDHCCHNVF